MFKKSDPREARRQVLQFLVDKHGQSVVARWTGKPDRQIADILAKRRSLGEKLAHAMEANWKQSTGEALDLNDISQIFEQNQSKPADTVEQLRVYAGVPVISWVQAGNWCGVVDTFEPGYADEWLPCPRPHGPNTFALRVRGVSMEPKYRDGSIIYVDPARQADHLSNIVVRMDDEKEATFKQLVIEGEKRFLRPLNPDWPGPKLIEINGSATICGVVIGQFIPD